MVAPVKQARRLPSLFAHFGYTENVDVSTATSNTELQFVRPCKHGGGPGTDRAHADDHIDVFLGTFRMDHNIALFGHLDTELGAEVGHDGGGSVDGERMKDKG